MATDTGRQRDASVLDKLDDNRFRQIGMLGTALFALVVAVFISYILLARVDYPLLINIIYPQFTFAFLRVIGIILISGVLAVVAGVIVGLARVSKRG